MDTSTEIVRSDRSRALGVIPGTLLQICQRALQ